MMNDDSECTDRFFHWIGQKAIRQTEGKESSSLKDELCDNDIC
jgi:hypothetical protein